MSAPSPLLLKLALRLLSSLKIPVDRGRIRERGFVLPVAILIVLVLSLVTVGLLTRSTQRTIQTQVERAEQTVSRQLNAAIDRARAKIDYLIRDPRLPASNPTDAQLVEALINDGAGELIPRDENDPYILPDETQFVITTNIEVEDPNNPGQTLPVPVRAPAWWFLVDTDNNGVNDSVTAYTILHTRRAAGAGFEDRLTDTERARRLLIRSGPLQGSALAGCTDSPAEQTVNPNVGDWFQVGTALYKPFQIFAVTLPIQGADSTTRAISALQFQQDRKRDLLNKWGIFSRGDVEFFFTPGYNWNGAIYAGGSLFFRYGSNNLFRAFTISSEQSCFYMPPDNSEITAFGELVAGAIGYAGQQVSDSLSFDAHPGVADVPPNEPPPKLNNLNSDSVQNGVEPESVALDPLELHLFGRIRPRGNYQQDAAGWAASPLNAKNPRSPGRIKAGGFQAGADQVCPPYVDDVYRADNRFGPKASYDRPPVTPDPQRGCDVDTFAQRFGVGAGSPIPANARNNQNESLTEDNPPPGALSEVGLDGYWERRARVEGLRVIVGQRLELTRTDSLPLPLVPPGDPDDPTKLQAIFISNEARQRLTLRDNPAAVQATAVYHYSHEQGRFPIACLATVAHPGTPWSLQRASTFPAGDQSNQLGINFFTGQGTNVWEYDPTPMQARLAPGTPLWTALTNLANFAGDPDGAYPPRQEPGRIHPDPFITAFGNFSELRRVIDIVNRGTSVDQLSLADQTTLQTAGCMLGMLADNILRIRDAANDASKPDPTAQILLNDIQASRAGNREAANRFYLLLRYIFPRETFYYSELPNPNDPPNDLIEDERRRAYPFLRELPFLGSQQRGSVTYRTLCDPSTCDLDNLGDLELIRLRPQPKINAWTLPYARLEECPRSPVLGNHPNSNRFELIRIGDQCYRVPFKDSVFYDGREAMAVRALNIDLALLTNNVNGQANGLINGDTWLPAGVQEGREGGIFYAFREDAVREDAIARPPLGTFDSYLTSWRNRNARGDLGSAGIMNAGQPGRGTANGQTVWDPPVSDAGLSPKPVDYYADPDRRPYGFRLRNGAVLARSVFNPSDNIRPTEALFGLSFISDNPVYIQGDFNLHQTRDGRRLEEFTTLLEFDPQTGLYSNFYGRRRANEDRRFARVVDPNNSRQPADLWRPSEVLGDSVNILSADFCDGSIDDGFVQDGTLNGGGVNYNPRQDYNGGRASAPRRWDYYGCLRDENGRDNLGFNTSFLNQALVIRGNNWPAPSPSRSGAGVLRFDNTDRAQKLVDEFGGNVRRPGWPEVFARDTIFARRGSTDKNSNEADWTAGGGVPEVRLLRAPDRGSTDLRNPGYADFGVRISALGNPVLDTSRWLLIAPLQPCPLPPGGGLLAEYYNGWLTSPQNRYDRETGFANTGVEVSELLRAPDANLPYLRAVRWPDPIYPAQDWQIGSFMKEEDQGGPTCNTSGGWGSSAGSRWACIRDALKTDGSGISGWDPPGNPPGKGFAFWKDGGHPDLPPWGGFYYLFANQKYINTNSPFLWPFGWDDWPLWNTRPTQHNFPKADFLWMPRCSEPDMNRPQPADDQDIDRGNIGFWRSCWRRRGGSWGSGNSWGNDLFVVRWVGELYPRWPGVATYNLNTDDGGRIIIRRNPAYRLGEGEPTPFFQGFYLNAGDTFLDTTRDENPENDAVGVEAWRDSDNNQVSFRLELQCADPDRPSPYLVEIQAYENEGNAFVRLTTQGDGHPLENYDLRYLKPLQPVNKPCQPDPQKALESNQAYCQTCEPIWDPPCPTDICQPVTITQTATLPAGCPGDPPPRRQVTCQPPGATCTSTAWTPACTAANGGQTITQSRTVTCTSSCGTTTTTETQTVTCPQICNYRWDPWTPASCNEVIDQIACGAVKTFDQSRTGYLIANTSSPGCPATKTETRLSGLRCQRNCGPATFAPEAPPKSPLGEWLAVKPNTVELRPVQEVQADPELETVSVHSVAKASTEGVTIALEPQLSPVLEVKAGVPKPPKWPNPAEALQAAFNWIFGEPAHAARRGLVRGGVLSESISQPNREPGIRPAIIEPRLEGSFETGSPEWARQLRRKLLSEDLRRKGLISNNEDVVCPSEDQGPDTDGGFWVPGVFRPNFNDRFRYEAYTAASRPSTLRIKDWDEDGKWYEDGKVDFWDKNRNRVRDSDEPLDVVDRDPLFGQDLDPGRQGLEIQPQMVLNPYAWVNEGDTQNYSPSSSYRNGYYIDTQGNEDVRNGLCFYVRLNESTNRVQVQIDRNGPTMRDGDFSTDTAAFAWVDVEPFTLDLNKNPTGFAGENPVLGVILDEVTRRPIPIPRFQGLASTDVNQRRRNDTGENNHQLQPARETRVNAIAISGTLPSRLDQTAGGMHNFLRLNELWRNTNLFFSGSMIQLNYSTYATGPFLQHSFEPPSLVSDRTFVRGYDYYYPPNRRFGYDVGLQIARRPGPVSSRFQFPSNTRTEFLRELDPQDPYVRRLRCALQNQPGVQLDPSAQIGGCEEFN
ncbi:hormogonium polysaccharide biosynthesis protein HpsA [Synechococcus sp. W60.3]|uniref:hormogonium polysaccharide biosynthesis protein HpsA n=1 Tax=Synechococcus sp. W60.3 TaxID=2967125 RepID=UPI0039C5BD2B